MYKRLLQAIALILVMTAGLNAQCFATCATQSLEHACCPHHKTAHADTVSAPSLPVGLPFAIVPQPIPAQLISSAGFAATTVLPPPGRPALTTTLRL